MDPEFRRHTVDYHSLRLSGGRLTPGTLSGLVGPDPEGLAVLTGIHTGVVLVAAVAVPGRPPVDLAGWEDVEEVTVLLDEGGCLRFVPSAVPGADPGGPSPLICGEAGPYRLRVHASGRDTNRDGVATSPRERYLMLCWPQDAAPATTPAATTATHAANLLSAPRREELEALARRQRPTEHERLRAAQLANLEAAARRAEHRDESPG